MSLQQLVDHFNDRFAQEHGFSFHPLMLQANAISAFFGKNQLNTLLSPVRNATNPYLITGHSAQIIATPSNWRLPDIENSLSYEFRQQIIELNSITSLDRLCRTIHLLNYLAISHANSFLLLDVDPRHILGIKYDHGSYFEDIIVYCGLKTKNVVISLTASGIHEEHHAQLLTGLNNYRECGYRIALNIGHHISSDRVLQLIKRLAPDYVSLTAPDENYTCLSSNATLATALKKLQELVTSLKGQTILQNVDRSEQSGCATQVGFDFVQGSYYEKSPDMLKRPKNNVKNYSYID